VTLLVLDVDLSAVMINDKIASHQVDAEFLGIVVAKEKRIEDGKKSFVGQARTIISNLDVDLLSFPTGSRAEKNMAARR
jgi:hypothetical protein